ncbi:lipocalin-like [Paroedura picta]|uniref:lipocalin-like n=1 Tax=Paroedura picta TaxID=143630 RepID=UPI004057C694
MTALLLIIALTSIFLLHAGADIPIQPDFNIQKIAGKWYHIALVMDKVEESPTTPSIQVVVPSSNGDLLFKYTSKKEGKCETHDVLLTHTDQPGKFLSSDKTNTLRIVEVNYESYYMLHIEMQKGAALHLYTRKPKGIAQERKKYKTRAKSMGFKGRHIQTLSRTDLCPV